MSAIAVEEVETLSVCLGTYPHTSALKKATSNPSGLS